MTLIEKIVSFLASLFKWETANPEIPPPEPPVPPPIASPEPVPLSFGSPQLSYHSVRVLCDNAGLSVTEKNLICAVIYQESQFHNNAINRNKNKKGEITSTDWGICQINDYFHCGPGKEFPSAAYVVAHAEEAVKYMITCYKQGLLRLWVGYSSGAYQQWLKPNSPMWALGTVHTYP